jgi:hypothetical protein
MAIPLAAAEIASSVEQLLKSITDRIEAKSSDSDLAHQVDRTKLNEPLSDNEIRWLAKAGAESKTLKALRKLQARSTCLTAHCEPMVQFEPQPTKEEIDGMLRQARNYARRYTASLIDFTCTVTVKTYAKERKGSRPLSDTSIVITAPSMWRDLKTTHREISYYRGREYYSDRNEKKQETSGSAWTNGEFAHLLRITFAPSSEARFDWDHWEQHGGEKLAVFSYSIDISHSQLEIDTQSIRSGIWMPAQITAAYRGFVSFDPKSGAIFHLVSNTFEIPSEYAINQGNTVLNYGPVEIAGNTYFLLTDAMSYIGTKQYEARFEKAFSQYRKFEAESKILER